MQIKEKYPMDGSETEQGRRDMRKGKSIGTVKVEGQEIHITFSYEGELAGNGSDIFRMVSNEELHVIQTLENKNGKNIVTKIYNRKK